MDASVISALAALMGAAIGAITSATASWLTQRTQLRTQCLRQDTVRRQDLYRQFIEEAATSYVDALQHTKADIPALVGVYAKIDRMRILSSPEVVASAERVARKIVDTYLEPDKSFVELRDMINSGAIALMSDFSKTCRKEFEAIRPRQLF